MNKQLVMIIGLVIIFVGYMSFVFWKKRRRNGLGGKKRKYKENEVENTSVQPVVIKEVEASKELFTEKGDRIFWYKITIFFLNESPLEYDFYSYNGNLTRDFILNERFYVNDREILIVDDTGEHYINQNRIEKIDYLQRKVMVSSNTESEGNFEDELKEIEQESIEKFESALSKEPSEVVQEEKNVALFEDQEKKRRFLKKSKVKNPSIKKMEAKHFNRIFMAVVCFILFSGVFALFRSFGIAGRVDAVQANVNKISEKSYGATEKKDDESYPFQLNDFMQNFISIYMPLSNDNSAMDDRTEQLKSYFAKNISLDKEMTMTTKKLISSELNNVKKSDKFSTAQYKIIYSLEIPVENKERVDSDKKEDSIVREPFVDYQKEEKTAFLNVDYVEKNGHFSIISYPYFSDSKKLTMNSEGVVKNEQANTAITGDQLKEIDTFLAIFFDKYASANEDELQYLMKDVESLGGNYELKEIVSVEAFSHKEFVTAYVQVIFTEKDSTLQHKEVFSLKLVKEDKQYKVIELRHNLGGF